MEPLPVKVKSNRRVKPVADVVAKIAQKLQRRFFSKVVNMTESLTVSDSDGAERLASSTIRRQRNGLPAFHQAQSWKRVEQRVQTAQ